MRVIVVFWVFAFSFAYGSENPKIFNGFWKNVGQSFKGNNKYYHLSGLALTPLLVESGIDAQVYDSNNHKDYEKLYKVGVISGGSGPFLLGVPLFLHGTISNNKESLTASYALFQSTLITVSYISLLKALTGRPPPDNQSTKSPQEQSEKFNFGFLKRGIVDGWPSGHAGVTTA